MKNNARKPKGKLVLLLFLIVLLLSACSRNTDNISSGLLEGNARTSESGIPESVGNNPDITNTSGGVLEVSFDFTRSTTPASNQFAIWIEDRNGNLIKTIYVTNFTANGGYERRKESLPTWVSKAKPAELTESEVDAVTGATPRTGRQIYKWDGTDENGNKVANGTYTVYVEGTLYWTSSVLFHGDFEVGGETQENISLLSDYTENDSTNRDMLTNISVKYLLRK